MVIWALLGAQARDGADARLLRQSEKLAVGGADAGDEALYNMLRRLCHGTWQILTLAPFAMSDLYGRAGARAGRGLPRLPDTYRARARCGLGPRAVRPKNGPGNLRVAGSARTSSIRMGRA